MSFILDALRKSENERQQTAVPGISDVPAVVRRASAPAWLLGLTAGLTACTLLLGWAWLSGLGAGAPEVSAPGPATGETGTLTSPETGFAAPVTGGGNVRSLAREARQSAGEERSSATAETPPAERPPPGGQADPAVTMAELLASGADLPELNLELHVFSAAPAERFVFINSAKYLEGETLPEGPRLVRITEDGVVLDYRSYSFLLQRQ